MADIPLIKAKLLVLALAAEAIAETYQNHETMAIALMLSELLEELDG